MHIIRWIKVYIFYFKLYKPLTESNDLDKSMKGTAQPKMHVMNKHVLKLINFNQLNRIVYILKEQLLRIDPKSLPLFKCIFIKICFN